MWLLGVVHKLTEKVNVESINAKHLLELLKNCTCVQPPKLPHSLALNVHLIHSSKLSLTVSKSQ